MLLPMCMFNYSLVSVFFLPSWKADDFPKLLQAGLHTVISTAGLASPCPLEDSWQVRERCARSLALSASLSSDLMLACVSEGFILSWG